MPRLRGKGRSAAYNGRNRQQNVRGSLKSAWAEGNYVQEEHGSGEPEEEEADQQQVHHLICSTRQCTKPACNIGLNARTAVLPHSSDVREQGCKTTGRSQVSGQRAPVYGPAAFGFPPGEHCAMMCEVLVCTYASSTGSIFDLCCRSPSDWQCGTWDSATSAAAQGRGWCARGWWRT